ncbi:MAG: hypothetical protein P4L67_02160 [Candidatus Pacebacteria bacterium]|nr:hypothetical protein [Candidatus Paceibacterota bacterium]
MTNEENAWEMDHAMLLRRFAECCSAPGFSVSDLTDPGMIYCDAQYLAGVITARLMGKRPVFRVYDKVAPRGREALSRTHRVHGTAKRIVYEGVMLPFWDANCVDIVISREQVIMVTRVHYDPQTCQFLLRISHCACDTELFPADAFIPAPGLVLASVAS